MSFFTKGTICIDCFKKEEEIRAKIIEDVSEEADLEYDGCGFVPRVREIRRTKEPMRSFRPRIFSKGRE